MLVWAFQFQWLAWAYILYGLLGVPIGSEHLINDVNITLFYDPIVAMSMVLHASGAFDIISKDSANNVALTIPDINFNFQSPCCQRTSSPRAVGFLTASQ